MAFNYAKAAATARALIANFGQEAVLIKPPAETGPVYDPTQSAGEEVPIRLVDLNISAKNADGAPLPGQFKRTVYISTEQLNGEFVVERTDRIRIGTGKDLEIAEVRPLNPAGTIVLWEADLVVQ